MAEVRLNQAKRQGQAALLLLLCFLLSLGAPQQHWLVLSAVLLACAVLVYLIARRSSGLLMRMRLGVYVTFSMALVLLLSGQVMAVLTLPLFILACYLLCARSVALALSFSSLVVAGLSALWYQNLALPFLMASISASAALILVLNVLFRELAALRQALAQSQRVDAASGALNRQALCQELAHYEQLHKRYGVNTSVIDLTLKSDALGMNEADFERFSKELVALLKSRIRKTDHLFRAERSRFVVLLAETPAASAARLEQDLLRAVEVYQFESCTFDGNSAPKLGSCLHCSAELVGDTNWVEQVLS